VKSEEDRGGAFMMADDESEGDISNRRPLALRGDIVPNELVRGKRPGDVADDDDDDVAYDEGCGGDDEGSAA
jgi:hypothetical protein